MDWFSTVGLSGEESIGIYSCSGEAEEKPALAVWSHCMGERAVSYTHLDVYKRQGKRPTGCGTI